MLCNGFFLRWCLCLFVCLLVCCVLRQRDRSCECLSSFCVCSVLVAVWLSLLLYVFYRVDCVHVRSLCLFHRSLVEDRSNG